VKFWKVGKDFCLYGHYLLPTSDNRNFKAQTDRVKQGLSTDILDVLNDNVYQCHLLIPTWPVAIAKMAF